MLRPPDTQTVHPVLHNLFVGNVTNPQSVCFFGHIPLHPCSVNTWDEERGARLELVPFNHQRLIQYLCQTGLLP